MSNTENATTKNTLHTFAGGTIYTGQIPSGNICWIEADNGGNPVEVPDINDENQMAIWLRGTGLSKADFIDKVDGLELWD